MSNYETMVRESYAPIIQKYNLDFVKFNDNGFFLIGHGFALWVFIDPHDGGDTWYVTINEEGNILTYSLMYISKERFTPQDRACAGNPITTDEHIEATFRVKCEGFLNHCHDILTGDKQWLREYPSKGNNSRQVAMFLKPHFEKQGLLVND